LTNLLDNKKRANHHWWPKGLQRQWVNSNGQLHMRKDGKVELKNPNNNRTGCGRNSHYFDVGNSPWSHSFEDAFRLVDTKGAEAVRQAVYCVQRLPIYWLSQSRLTSWLPFRATATETDFDMLSKDDIHCIARLAISIVIRSPAFKFKKSILHPAFSKGDIVDPQLGKQNIWQYWAELYRNPQLPIESISVVFLLTRRGHEFVMGDGFYQSVVGKRSQLKRRGKDGHLTYEGAILMPLSPDICSLVLFNSRLGQKTVVLSDDETAEINEITCISSRNEIYFRDQDHPNFRPARDSNVREVSLTEHSFLKPWVETVETSQNRI